MCFFLVVRYVEVFRSLSKFVLHPLIHTSRNRVFTPGYCSLVSRGKVWIKVCYLQFLNEKAGPKLTLPFYCEEFELSFTSL